MGKKLPEMSLAELWQLFPIYLTEHNESWAAWYAEEEANLKVCLPAEQIKQISHIGSTAIKGIWAKPIIDILVAAAPESDLQQIKSILEKAGYLYMSESPERVSFNKGYTDNGFAEGIMPKIWYIKSRDLQWKRDISPCCIQMQIIPRRMLATRRLDMFLKASCVL